MTTKNEARLNVRLPAELNRTIEEAAAQLGQTVSDRNHLFLSLHLIRQLNLPEA
ncbi:MAG TPA: hypothetical protein PK867_08410 [Pirellulales bacterium]|nr:hypothetical protein [Pirellulales bacterium]